VIYSFEKQEKNGITQKKDNSEALDDQDPVPGPYHEPDQTFFHLILSIIPDIFHGDAFQHLIMTSHLP